MGFPFGNDLDMFHFPVLQRATFNHQKLYLLHFPRCFAEPLGTRALLSGKAYNYASVQWLLHVALDVQNDLGITLNARFDAQHKHDDVPICRYHLYII